MPPSVYLCAAGIDTLHFKQQTLRNRPFKLGFKLPQIDKALFLTLPMSLRVSAEAWPTQEWQSAGLDYWEDHMPLSTPAGCVGGGLASPRIGPENLSPGSQAGLDSGVVKRQHNTASEKTYQMPFSDLFFIFLWRPWIKNTIKKRKRVTFFLIKYGVQTSFLRSNTTLIFSITSFSLYLNY